MVDLVKAEEWEKKAVINRIDATAFQHSFMESAMACPAPEGPWRSPKFVRYVRDKASWPGITYITDKLLHVAPQVQSKFKVAILQEPPELLPQIYEVIQQYEEHYDVIFTYVQELIDHNPEKYVFYPPDMPALEPAACKMHDKTKLASMIYSSKQDLPGHKLRHRIANEFIIGKELDKRLISLVQAQVIQ